MDKKKTELHWVAISGATATYYGTFIKLAKDLRHVPDGPFPVKIYTLKNMKKPYNLEELDDHDLISVWHKGQFHPPEYLDNI